MELLPCARYAGNTMRKSCLQMDQLRHRNKLYPGAVPFSMLLLGGSPPLAPQVPSTRKAAVSKLHEAWLSQGSQRVLLTGMLQGTCVAVCAVPRMEEGRSDSGRGGEQAPRERRQAN